MSLTAKLKAVTDSNRCSGLGLERGEYASTYVFQIQKQIKETKQHDGQTDTPEHSALLCPHI